jgi:hypothetical protein
MVLACTVVTQSGIDGRYAATMRSAKCRRLQTGLAKAIRPEEIQPGVVRRLGGCKRKLDIPPFVLLLRLAAGSDFDRQSHNEKTPSF